MPWLGYVTLFNHLTHFCQFQKVDSFVDGWNNFLWILRDSISASLYFAFAHLKMEEAIWGKCFMPFDHWS